MRCLICELIFDGKGDTEQEKALDRRDLLVSHFLKNHRAVVFNLLKKEKVIK